MSVFKRLSNVARGKMKEFGRSFSDPDGGPDEVDPDTPPPRHADSAPEQARPAAGEGSKRELLARMHAEGLLTDAELASKLAELEAPPPPPKRMKRSL